MRNEPKKGQSGIELITFISFSLLIFSVFYIILLDHSITNINQKRNLESQAITDRIAYEIDIAKAIGTGYEKKFTIPDTILGISYDIEVDDNMVVVNSTHHYIRAITTETVIGTIIPGANTVKNINGIIYVNT